MFEALSVEPVLPVGQGQPVMLDGRCGEAEWAGGGVTALGAGVTLIAKEDGQRVYLCIQPPADSLGTLDIHLQPHGSPVLNLHVSAQVGERLLGPDGWPDYVWRNNLAWYGTPVPFVAFDRGGEDRPARLEFASGFAREIALEKTRFGPLPWRIRLEVRSLGADRRGMIAFPAAATAEDPTGWATLGRDPVAAVGA